MSVLSDRALIQQFIDAVDDYATQPDEPTGCYGVICRPDLVRVADRLWGPLDGEAAGSPERVVIQNSGVGRGTDPREGSNAAQGATGPSGSGMPVRTHHDNGEKR